MKISVEELEGAAQKLVQYEQNISFLKKINQLNHKQPVAKNSSIQSLCPTIKEDLLCVGGRLKNAVISDKMKSPRILLRSHHLIQLIIN